MTKTNLDFTADEAKKLPEHQGNVMLLLLTGHTYEQIAIDLGLAAGTVKSRINRARKKIKQDKEPRVVTAAGNESPRRSRTSAPRASKSNPPDADK